MVNETCDLQEQQPPQQQQHQQRVQQQKLREGRRKFTFNGNQYDRIRILGKGSFGIALVYRRYADFNLVVLKEIDLSKFKGEYEYNSAIDEARIMSKLNHPNIISYYNAYLTESKLIIEMEYASLGPLSSYLSQQVEPLNEFELLVIFRQITSGLAYLHSESIIHLDLKMANIFVTSEGLVKIGDFGIAQFLKRQDHYSGAVESELELKVMQSSSSHLGTLAYSSPERCLGGSTDTRSDIWSLGCILYELITGRLLFTARSLAELVLVITRIQYQPIDQSVSQELVLMFEKTISKSPMDRPSADELLESTDKLLLRAQESHHRRASSPTTNRTARRKDNSPNMRGLIERSSVFQLRRDNDEPAANHQVSYFRSLVYRVKLDEQPIRVDRVNLPQSKRIKEIVKGKSHYLALTYDGVVYGWGSRHQGQLGACGLDSQSSKRRSARSLLDFSSLSKQEPSSVRPSKQAARLLASSLASFEWRPTSPSRSIQWGQQAVMEQLKELSPVQRPFVLNELSQSKIVQVGAGKNFSVFLSKTGIVLTCGLGSSGCLGRGNLSSCFKPCMVESLLDSNVICVSCGPKHVVVVCGDGRAFAWGENQFGQLGLGEMSAKFVLQPQEVEFPKGIVIKSVVCGHKCSVFIDSRDRCWATGLNKFNRLGFDVKRRFKKTILVQESWRPREIIALARKRIINCRVAQNHLIYLTSEGRLMVLGQDITPHREQRGLLADAKSQASLLSSQPSWPVLNPAKLVAKLAWPTFERAASKRKRVLSSENFLAVGCNGKYSVALTSSNRVYFWGFRSYRLSHSVTQNQQHQFSAPICPRCRTIEPQLANRSNEEDQSLVKIGVTNHSLMRNIETFGSDQPIIDAQDPRLIAETLADLWILDHQAPDLSQSGCCCSSTSSSSTSLSSCSSYCDSPGSTNQSSCSPECDSMSTIKHHAILEPQPIVSLYKPSMFNSRGCSLYFSELFCFDEDCFYLTLDTSIRTLSTSCNNRSQIIAGADQLHTTSKTNLLDRPQPQPELERATSSAGNRSPTPLPGCGSRSASEQRLFPANSMRIEDELSQRSESPIITPDEEPDNYRENMAKANRDQAQSERDSSDSGPKQQRSESVSGLSLEEPRSLSTFTYSIGNQVIVSPLLQVAEDLDHLEQVQELNFDQTSFPLNQLERNRRARRTRRRANNRSESTTNTFNELDEISSLPSWVKNEYIANQQEDHLLDLAASVQSDDHEVIQLEDGLVESDAQDKSSNEECKITD